MQVALPVGVVEKAGQAVVAVLHEVLGNAGKVDCRAIDRGGAYA
jgi:hypothetical protein